MKRPTQDPRTGAVTFEDLPAPTLQPGGVVVRAHLSFLHVAALLPAVEIVEPVQTTALAKAEPKKGLVRRLWSSFRNEGIKSAYNTFSRRNLRLKSVEYAAVGTVTEAAPGSRVKVGQRVVWTGYGTSLPAQLTFVSLNRCVVVPENIPDETALLALPGGIALRAFRAADPRLGTSIGILGDNLVGKLVGTLARTAGCTVIFVGPDSQPRVTPPWDAVVVSDADLAEKRGGLVASAVAPGGRVVVATKNVPPDLVTVCRRRELHLVPTWAGGGGLSDPLDAESEPRRTMDGFLELAAKHPLGEGFTPERLEFDKADGVFDALFTEETPTNRQIVVVYPQTVAVAPAATRFDVGQTRAKLDGGIGLSLLTDAPLTEKALFKEIAGLDEVRLVGFIHPEAATAKAVATSQNFDYGATNFQDAVSDGKTDAAILIGGGDSFPVLKSLLEARVSTLAFGFPFESENDLRDLGDAVSTGNALFLPGFTRLFAPAIRELERRVAEEKVLWVSLNAVEPLGPDAESLAERMLFRAAEAIALASFLCEAAPVRVLAQQATEGATVSLTALVAMSNGASLQFSCAAAPNVVKPTERLELVATGKRATSDNLLNLEIVKGDEIEKVRIPHAEHRRAALEAFIAALETGGQSPIPFEASYIAIRTAFKIRESLEFGKTISLNES
jgi:predicted dehydrogenase